MSENLEHAINNHQPTRRYREWSNDFNARMRFPDNDLFRLDHYVLNNVGGGPRSMVKMEFRRGDTVLFQSVRYVEYNDVIAAMNKNCTSFETNLAQYGHPPFTDAIMRWCDFYRPKPLSADPTLN